MLPDGYDAEEDAEAVMALLNAREIERYELIVEPDILHAPAVEGAVHHNRQALEIRALAGTAAAVENDRPHTVVGQLALDRLFYRLVAKPCCPSIRQGPSNFDCVCALGAALP